MCFDGGIGFAVSGNGDANGCESHGRGGAEKAGKALGSKHLCDHGEEADNDSADEESGEHLADVDVHDGPQAARCAFWIMRIATSASLQPSSLYSLLSRRW